MVGPPPSAEPAWRETVWRLEDDFARMRRSLDAIRGAYDATGRQAASVRAESARLKAASCLGLARAWAALGHPEVAEALRAAARRAEQRVGHTTPHPLGRWPAPGCPAVVPRPSGDGWGPLSPREREVAPLVAAGLTNRQIGRRLCLEEGTVANHVRRSRLKLGLDSRTQLGVWVASDARRRSTVG